MRLGPLIALPGATLLAAALLTGCNGPESPDSPAESSALTSATSDPGESADPTAGASSAVGPPPIQFRMVRVSGRSEASATDLGELGEQFRALDCAAGPDLEEVSAEEPMVSCDRRGLRYLLEPAMVEAAVETAESQNDESGNPLITLEFGPEATAELARETSDLARDQGQLALVVNGEVLTAPTVVSTIDQGIFQIAGEFTDDEADALVERLTAGG